MLLINESEFSSEETDNSNCVFKTVNDDEIPNEELKYNKTDSSFEYHNNRNNTEGDCELFQNDLRIKDEKEENGRFNFEQSKKDYGTDYNFKREIVWKNVIGFAILHLLGLYGYLLCFTHAKLLTTVYALLLSHITGQGITAGAHRLWAHRTYKALLPLKIFLLIAQVVTGQNCLWVWVRDHRQHHRYSDTDGDPHNAKRGLFFSHIGWLMSKKHPLVKELGKTIDMSDLQADPWVMLQKKYYKSLHFVFGFLIPVLTPVFFWNENFWVSVLLCYFGRYIYQLNVTWSLNSFAHKYGNKPYNKDMLPVDNKSLAILTLGEGWHNFHHTFPWDYRTGEWGGIHNTSVVFLNFMHYIGQAYDMKTASPALIKSRMQRTGDGTVYDHIHIKKISKQL